MPIEKFKPESRDPSTIRVNQLSNIIQSYIKEFENDEVSRKSVNLIQKIIQTNKQSGQQIIFSKLSEYHKAKTLTAIRLFTAHTYTNNVLTAVNVAVERNAGAQIGLTNQINRDIEGKNLNKTFRDPNSAIDHEFNIGIQSGTQNVLGLVQDDAPLLLYPRNLLIRSNLERRMRVNCESFRLHTKLTGVYADYDYFDKARYPDISITVERI